MCKCKNQRATGKQAAGKLWGVAASDTWPPLSKPAPFTDKEMKSLKRIIQDGVAEHRRKQAKPVLSASQVNAIRRMIQDARAPKSRPGLLDSKPVRESYHTSDSKPEYRSERIIKIRTADSAMHGKIVTIGNMRCQLVHGKMICR